MTSGIIALLLLLVPGLPSLWISFNWELPTVFWTYLLIFYLIAGSILALIAGFEKKIEIHPDKIYVKDSIFFQEFEYPVKDKMVLMMENYPFIQVIFPREMWKLSVGYPDDVFMLVQEINDHDTIRKIARILSKKFEIPLVDYTYVDQSDVVLFIQPENVDLPFPQRAVRFPDLLVFGELPGDKTIQEELVSSGKRIYRWTALNFAGVLRTLLIAGIAIVLILFGVVSSRADAVISIPVIGDDRVLYYLVVLWVLGKIAYESGVQKILTVDLEKITYRHLVFNYTIHEKEIDTGDVLEVRVKPTPKGFSMLIIGKDDTIDVRTHLGGINDFIHLLWLTGRVQDFLLDTRMPPDVLEMEKQKLRWRTAGKKIKTVAREETTGEKNSSAEDGKPPVKNEKRPEEKEKSESNSKQEQAKTTRQRRCINRQSLSDTSFPAGNGDERKEKVMEKERTLLLIKPDSVHRGLIGKIISKYEQRGFVIAAMKLIWMKTEQAEELYKPHRGKSFYEPTVKYMTSSPIVAMVIEGYDAVNQVRKMNGATCPEQADPGTIRGDFAQRVEFNCVHGADSVENAKREIAIFFDEEEILDYDRVIKDWL